MNYEYKKNMTYMDKYYHNQSSLFCSLKILRAHFLRALSVSQTSQTQFPTTTSLGNFCTASAYD